VGAYIRLQESLLVSYNVLYNILFEFLIPVELGKQKCAATKPVVNSEYADIFLMNSIFRRATAFYCCYRM
jgi:hypothetical protein